jgi:hypothetical protein
VLAEDAEMDPLDTAMAMAMTKEEAADALTLPWEGQPLTFDTGDLVTFRSPMAFPLTISFGQASPLRLLVETAEGGRPLDAFAEAMDALSGDAGDPGALAAALSAWRACRVR